jgi:mono/diheme cytochrome c family protein
VFKSKLLQAVIITVILFLIIKFGIRPPIPGSLVTLYMAIICFTMFIFVSSDEDSWRNFTAPILATLADDDKAKVRLIVFIIFPILVGFGTFTRLKPSIEAPAELRVIHPAPPSSIQFKDRTIQIGGLVNPLREDGGSLKSHLKEGAAVYFRNCFFCHGDALDGKGHFAAAFNLPPADFTDAGTIAQLQESYLFWRIAKGGVGLPKESKPWNSSMPAWEKVLTEEEIWKVIIYLYDAAGVSPRRWE